MACYLTSFYVRVKGKQVTAAEAPVLCIAPHSSFFDAGFIYFTNSFPSPVARWEHRKVPVLGCKLINDCTCFRNIVSLFPFIFSLHIVDLTMFTQPVYVKREDPNSRQNAVREIIRRAKSRAWPQVALFPEGTTANRSCLITFKPGEPYHLRSQTNNSLKLNLNCFYISGAFIPGLPVQPVIIRYPNTHVSTTSSTRALLAPNSP